MADATQLPALKLFQWSRPDAANPRLASPIDSDDTTLTFTNAPKDEDDNVVSTAFLMGIRNSDSYVETVYVPAGALSGDGLTATGVTRGIDLTGIDYTVGDSSLAASHAQDSPVFCNVTGVYHTMARAALQGTIATGGNNLIIGDEADSNKTILAALNAGNVGFIRKNSTTGKAQFSNDGSTWTDIDDVTASDLLIVSANDTTPGDLETKLVAGTNTTVTVNNDGGNETIQVNASGTLANVLTDITATAAEINQMADGISGNVTQANLDTLVGGTVSNADALHTHSGIGTVSLTAGEAIDGSTTPQAIAVLGENFVDTVEQWTTQAGYAFVYPNTSYAFGDADSTTWRAASFSYTNADADTITITELWVGLYKTGGPGDNVKIEIYTDSGGSPDALVTNGVSDNVSGSSLNTTDESLVRFTFSTPPTITSGTTYWFVLKRTGANSGAAYYNVLGTGGGSGHKTYTASTMSWSNLTGNDILFYMKVNCDYGGKVFKSDADNTQRAKFDGFTSDNVAEDAAISVKTNGIEDSFSGLTKGIPYKVGTTEGGITVGTSLINAEIPVGTALSDTILTIDKKRPFYHLKIDDIIAVGDIASAINPAAFDYFVATGFTPAVVEMHYSFADDSASTVAQINKTYNVTTQGVSLLNTASQTVTAQSVIFTGGVSGDPVSIQEVKENGVVIRIDFAQAVDTLQALILNIWGN